MCQLTDILTVHFDMIDNNIISSNYIEYKQSYNTMYYFIPILLSHGHI